MTNANNNVASTPDRVKLPFSFDAAKMQADIEALELRNADSIPLRGPAYTIDSPLPIPPSCGRLCRWHLDGMERHLKAPTISLPAGSS